MKHLQNVTNMAGNGHFDSSLDFQLITGQYLSNQTLRLICSNNNFTVLIESMCVSEKQKNMQDITR